MSFFGLAIAAVSLWGLAMAGLAIGLILQRKALSGSCGGVDADGKPLADCLCEKAREAQLWQGLQPPQNLLARHLLNESSSKRLLSA